MSAPKRTSKKERQVSKSTRGRSPAKRDSQRPARSKSGPRPVARGRKATAGARRSLLPSSLTRHALPLDLKLDILGLILMLVGLFTLLSSLSVVRSGFTAWWVENMAKIFGWGRFLLPFGLLAAGFWLLLRRFERLPRPAFESAVGYGLLFWALLTSAHYLLALTTGAEPLILAQAGRGGGYLGGLSAALLDRLLGVGGTLIALAAWMVIALALALEVTVADMGRWLAQKVQQARGYLRPKRQEPLLLEEGDAPPDGELPAPWISLRRGIPAEGASLAAATAPRVGETATQSSPQTWVLPSPQEILEPTPEVAYDQDLERRRARIIEETLASFGAPCRVVEIHRGPAITQFGVEPDFVETRGGRVRVRVGKIASLADDLALALSARTIRVQARYRAKAM